MEFLAEDMGRCAMMRVIEKEVKFSKVSPERVCDVDVAIVGKAKVVVVHGAESASDEQLEAVRDAWVLVVNGDVDEDVVAAAHPYVTIVKGEELRAKSEVYEQFSRGWNVENADGAHMQRKVICVGTDDCVEVLFGESRENPIGLLSVKTLKK